MECCNGTDPVVSNTIAFASRSALVGMDQQPLALKRDHPGPLTLPLVRDCQLIRLCFILAERRPQSLRAFVNHRSADDKGIF